MNSYIPMKSCKFLHILMNSYKFVHITMNSFEFLHIPMNGFSYRFPLFSWAGRPGVPVNYSYHPQFPFSRPSGGLVAAWVAWFPLHLLNRVRGGHICCVHQFSTVLIVGIVVLIIIVVIVLPRRRRIFVR